MSCGGSITSFGEERAYFPAIVYCNYVVSVRKGFLFVFVLGMGCVINSPEPSGSQRELINYPCSGVRRRRRRRQQFQTSSTLKPLGQSNSMWSLLGKGERKFI